MDFADFSLTVVIFFHNLASVVTGSTDGIGKAYALELARKGFAIVLISRTQSKLDAVKEEIKKECDTEVLFFILKHHILIYDSVLSG